MNLPNKLTVLRVILVPFFVAFLLLSKSSESLKWIALVLFIAASLTDLLDGKIARKYNLVTTFYWVFFRKSLILQTRKTKAESQGCQNLSPLTLVFIH